MTVWQKRWEKAGVGQRRLAVAALADFLGRLYERYDQGDRCATIRAQVDWFWAAAESPAEEAPTPPPVDPESAAAAELVPDDNADSRDVAALGQSAALGVLEATAAVVWGDAAAWLEAWESFDECRERLTESPDDGAAYEDGLRALRGLPVEQIKAGIAALNARPAGSAHAKRARAAFRAAESVAREALAVPAGRDGVAEMRRRISEIVVPALP